MAETPISELWLASIGFKWHQLDRQTDKHWLLWLGAALRSGPQFQHVESFNDLGIELAPSVYADQWYCWLRSDISRRYGRFLHIRHLRTREELIRLIEGLTDLPWHPGDVLYGILHTPAGATHLRHDAQRLDKVLASNPPHWRTCETDETQGTALPEHLEHYMTRRAE